ncbi:MAG: S8 family serine peptidase, partial [Ginsengibacter sp.]
TNTKEIPGNGIDDDKNGYTDDVHGWNFLGGKDGGMMYAVSTEADREYARLLPEYAWVKDSLQEINNKGYQYFLSVKKQHLKDSIGRSITIDPGMVQAFHILAIADSSMQKLTQKQHIYFEDVSSFEPKDSILNATKQFVLHFYAMVPPGVKLWPLDSIVANRMEYLNEQKNEQLLFAQLINDPNELRKEIIGDNPLDINDKYYGNNIVDDSKYGSHGTHCSGIIAAARNNGIGMDGITDNVLIMPVRAGGTFHIGDESDKDIALAIRYAVDNGAKIISMSFGKSFSPQKEWVDDAVKYAEQKGVLLVHGAGNDGTDSDSTAFYPNADFLDSSGRAKNMITVGAISIDTGFALLLSYSNYGQKNVDVFAPGADIYSCIPGNKYEFKSGTSMATPVVAGVAALILEYYPNLNAEQVKDIIMKSVTSLKGKMVYKPGTKEKVDFSMLCVSGGVVNGYKALQLAEVISLHKN